MRLNHATVVVIAAGLFTLGGAGGWWVATAGNGSPSRHACLEALDAADELIRDMASALQSATNMFAQIRDGDYDAVAIERGRVDALAAQLQAKSSPRYSDGKADCRG